MVSSGGRLGWLLVAVACQFVWGIYPAGLRYMQTMAERPLTSLQLSFLINLLACPALFFGTTLPLWLMSACRSRKGVRQAALVHAGAGEAQDGPTAVVVASSLPTSPPQGSPTAASDGAIKAPAVPPASSGKGAAPEGDGKPSAPAWDSALTEPLLAAEEDEEAEAAAAQHAQHAQQQGLQAGPPAAETPSAEHSLAPAGPLASPPIATEPPAAAQAALPHPTRQPATGASWRRVAGMLALTTLFLTGLFLAQVFSLLFTTAYMSQMVFLLAPVIVALLSKALFKTPLPPGLWPALFCMLLGCGMVIGSKAMAAGAPSNGLAGRLAWRAAGDGRTGPAVLAGSWGGGGLWQGAAEEAWLCTAVFGEDWGTWLCDLEELPTEEPQAGSSGSGTSAGGGSEGSSGSGATPAGSGSSGSSGKIKHHRKKPSGGLGLRDVLGIFLSFLGACSLAAFMMTVQRTHGMVSEQQVLWANFLFQTCLCSWMTYHFEYWRLGTLKHLGLAELGQVAALAAGVNWGANFVQQLCIRALGAPQAAAFLPVRLLGSLAASYPLLSEGLTGPMQWGGVAVLMAAVTGYLLKQKQAAEATALEAAMREADAEDAAAAGGGV